MIEITVMSHVKTDGRWKGKMEENKDQVQPLSRNKLLGVAGVGWMFDAMDVGILSFVIAALAVDWGLSSSQMGWIGSVNSIGMAVGALLFGVLADKIGRKQIFMWTLIVFSVASGISALTTTFAAFLVFRFLKVTTII